MIPVPSTLAPLVNAARGIVAPWLQYLQQFTQAPPNFMDITVTPTPFEYIVKEPGNLFITGGTISAITLTRGAISLTVTGQKFIPVAIKDVITIAYSVLPTMTFIPSYGQNTFNG